MSHHNSSKKKQNSSDKKKYKFRKTNYDGDYSLKDGELERIEQLAYNAYSNEMLTPTSQIMNMKFYDPGEIAMRGYEPFFKPILHYLWRTDPNNWEKMNVIQNRYYKKVFPNNPEMKLGIDSMLKFDDLQKEFINFQNKKHGGEYMGKQFKYAFSEDYIQTLVKAPKMGLYHYESNNRMEDRKGSETDPIYKRRIIDVVALKVDGETLLGEIETVYKGAPKYFTPDELNGSVKFTLYYQGHPEMPIDIMRDDFIRTGSAHANKIDSNYHLNLDYHIPRHTKFSHRHFLSDILQLPFTRPNQSINVEPLPINKNNMEKGEKKYDTLLDMRKDTWDSLHFDGTVVNEKELLTKRLKKTIDETLSGKELNSKYGKLISNAEIAECKAKYNSAIKQVKDRDIDSYLMSGGKDEDSLAIHDIRQAYFRVTRRNSGPILKLNSQVEVPKLDDSNQEQEELPTL